MVRLFRNPGALQESTDVQSLSGQQKSEAKNLKNKLDKWLADGDNKIIAYSGKFGTGKSSVLKYIESQYSQERIHWLGFESWRYVDRAKIWDGFVIEVVSKIRKKSTRKDTRYDIDGYKKLGKFMQKHLGVTVCLILIVWPLVSYLIWRTLNSYDADLQWVQFAKLLLKYSLPVLFATLALLSIGSLLIQRGSSLSRIEELEELLAKYMRKLDRPLVVVAEDIDRAREEGMVFLETLRDFLNNRTNQKKHTYPIIVIAPQDSAYLSSLKNDVFERSIKIYDTTIYYSPHVIRSSADVDRLLQEAQLDMEKYGNSLRAAIGMLPLGVAHQIPFRLLKFLLRELQEFSDTQASIDAGLGLILISLRYSRYDDNNTYLDVLRRELQKSSVLPTKISASYGEANKIAQLLVSYYRSKEDEQDKLKDMGEISNYMLGFSCKEEIDVDIARVYPVGSCDLRVNLSERYLPLVE